MSSEIAPTTPPGYPAQQRQPSEGGFYPLPGACPSYPVQQQPISTMHNTNTTVVIQQQSAAVIVQGPRDWSTGMCACFDDCGVCKSGGRGTGQMSTNSELSKDQTKLHHSESATSVLPFPAVKIPWPTCHHSPLRFLFQC
jgi:hypothetical protein